MEVGACPKRPSSLLLHTSPPLLCLDRSGATTLRKLNAGLCTSSPHSPTSIHTVAYWFRYISTSENGCPLFTSFSCYTMFDLPLCRPRVIMMLFLCPCWLFFPCFTPIPMSLTPYAQAQHYKPWKYPQCCGAKCSIAFLLWAWWTGVYQTFKMYFL